MRYESILDNLISSYLAGFVIFFSLFLIFAQMKLYK